MHMAGLAYRDRPMFSVKEIALLPLDALSRTNVYVRLRLSYFVAMPGMLQTSQKNSL